MVAVLLSTVVYASQQSPLSDHFWGCRSAELLRTRSIVHRRGDSFSSLRSDDDGGDLDDFEQRPLFFMHGVGLGLVSHTARARSCHVFAALDMQIGKFAGDVGEVC